MTLTAWPFSSAPRAPLGRHGKHAAVNCRSAASGNAAIALGRPAVPTAAGRTIWALGTFCSILVTRPATLNAAQRILSAELAKIDLACSRFRPDSELSALNRSNGRRVAVSATLARALLVALWAAETTDGDVDPTCGRSLVALGYDKDYSELAADTSALAEPPAPAPGWRYVDFNPARRTIRVPPGVLLDLGATAKALAADLAADAIYTQLGTGVLVNLGGDVAIAGQAPGGGGGWRIGVDDGVTTADDPHCVAVEAGGVATSCPAVRGWRRGDRDLHHIVEPSTGQPAEIYWAAASVAAATCVDANTASTAAIVRGRAARGWLQDLRLPARLVTPDGRVVTTGGWPR